MSKILIALIWPSLLCNGKIAKRISPGKLDANPGIECPHSRPHARPLLPPSTHTHTHIPNNNNNNNNNKKKSKGMLILTLNPDPDLSPTFLHFLDPNPELTTNANSMDSRNQREAPIRN